MRLRLAIFGVGLSGQAAKRLALAQGHEVTLFDEAGGGDKGSFDLSQLARYDRFIFSPGFAADHPWRLQAERSGKRVQSEISFAAEHWKGHLIGITGTNGKTTLTHFLAEALQRAGKNAVFAGNIGQPLSDVILDVENVESAYAVCEISSFQAELSRGIQLDGLLWTNFAEDHLDRYESMAHYFLAKAELFKCLKPDSVCVIGPQVVPWLDRVNEPFGRARIANEDRALMSRLRPDSVFTRFPYSENFALAAEFWRLTAEPVEALLAAANEFKLAPHRLDVVVGKGGVNYWNDSKSTNFHSTLAAVQAVPRPIIWIGGGRIKGGNLGAFAKELAPQIDAAVLYGEAAPQMMEALTDQLENVRVVPAFDQAVRVASKLAAACTPANVVLSPGFPSFDQFTSYEARGKSFNSIVLGL
jgi:UDP-N-acetylmuramoylalanine--D-glutamate ligase